MGVQELPPQSGHTSNFRGLKCVRSTQAKLFQPNKMCAELAHPSRLSGRMLLMKYRVYLEPDEDGVFVATCPALPGCVSQGRTRVEAIENIREAIELCLETDGLPVVPLTRPSV